MVWPTRAAHARSHRALAASRPQILFDVPNASAAAANLFGLAAERCFPRMLKCGAFHLNQLRTAEGKAAVLAAAPPPAPTRESGGPAARATYRSLS